MKFDPFADRLSRKIRNDLSAALVEMLEKLDPAPVKEIADRYRGRAIGSVYLAYIDSRLRRYQLVVEIIRQGPDDLFWQALILWDQQLFFEVHELLEQAWRRAAGPEKIILQAMIRAAGAYIKLESGSLDAARKMADRALPVLLEHREFLMNYFDPDKLVHALHDLTLSPPQLLCPEKRN